MQSIQYTLFLNVMSTENTKYVPYLRFALLSSNLHQSVILPDYLTSDLAFRKRLINVWSTLATFNGRWVNVYL